MIKQEAKRRRRARRAWVDKRRGADGKLRYHVRWTDHAGVRHSQLVVQGGLADARRVAAAKMEELNTVGDIPLVPWADFVKQHTESLTGKSPDYISEHKRVLERFGEFAPPYVCDVGVAAVEAFRAARLEDGVKLATVNKDLRTLKAALSHAVSLNYLRTNPACRVKMLKVALSPRRVLSAEECQKLLGACPNEWWRAFVHVALTTGMRRGELLALEWSDLDLKTGAIRVVNKPGHATKSRRERVTSTDAAGCRILAWIKTESPQALTHGELTGKVFRLVRTKEGVRFSPRAARRRFGEIVKKAGIPHCTLHDLRRTSLTVLASKLPAFALQQRAGHQSPSTTAKYYLGDTTAATAPAVSEAFEDFLGGSDR